MRRVAQVLSLVLCFSLLLSCTQSTGGMDYRDEVGDNGLPTPRALFAKYVDAMGGEAVVKSHSSMTQRGKFLLSSFGLEGEMTIQAAAPNLLSQTIELPGFGTIRTGYDGEVAWSMDPMQGNSIIEGDQLADLLRQADFYLALNLAAAYGEQETVEVVQVSGSDAYKVRALDSEGKQSLLYFSAESAQLVRTDASVSSPLGVIEVFTVYEGHTGFEGLILPTSMLVSQAGQEFEIQIDSISFDDVDETAFAIPAEIQGLL